MSSDTLVRAVNPFPGPRAYRAEDEASFGGREWECQALVSLIVSSRLVLLYAASGTGKTSLLQAGVLPALTRRDFDVLPMVRFGEGLQLDPTGCGDGPDFFSRFVATTMRRAGQARFDGVDDLATLAEAVDASSTNGRSLLVLDQFEEIFSAHQDRWKDRDRFFEQLRHVLDSSSSLRVLLAMRSDYLAELVSYRHLLPDDLSVRYQLEPLQEEQAGEVIETSFARSGHPLESDEIQRIVTVLRIDGTDDQRAPSEFVNPVRLQITCRPLWDGLGRAGWVTGPARTAVIDDHVDNSEIAFVDEVVSNISEALVMREGELREWMQDELITDSGRRAVLSDDDRSMARLPDGCIDALEQERLVQIENRGGRRLIELSHDSMVVALRESNERFWRAGTGRGGRYGFVWAAVITALVMTMTYRLLDDRSTGSSAITDYRVASGDIALLGSFRAPSSGVVVVSTHAASSAIEAEVRRAGDSVGVAVALAPTSARAVSTGSGPVSPASTAAGRSAAVLVERGEDYELWGHATAPVAANSIVSVSEVGTIVGDDDVAGRRAVGLHGLVAIQLAGPQPVEVNEGYAYELEAVHAGTALVGIDTILVPQRIGDEWMSVVEITPSFGDRAVSIVPVASGAAVADDGGASLTPARGTTLFRTAVDGGTEELAAVACRGSISTPGFRLLDRQLSEVTPASDLPLSLAGLDERRGFFLFDEVSFGSIALVESGPGCAVRLVNVDDSRLRGDKTRRDIDTDGWEGARAFQVNPSRASVVLIEAPSTLYVALVCPDTGSVVPPAGNSLAAAVDAGEECIVYAEPVAGHRGGTLRYSLLDPSQAP